MTTLQAFVDTNCPQAVTLTAEQIITVARECGYEIEYPNAKEGKKSFFKGLFTKKQPEKNYNANGRIALIYTRVNEINDKYVAFRISNTRESVYYDFGQGRLVVEYESRIQAGNIVNYTPRIKNSKGFIFALETVLYKMGLSLSVEVATPEPIVEYPLDRRDGVPEEGTLLFLSRARELARGNTEVENILQDPTGEILWEAYEDCRVCCQGWWSKPFLTKEEAEEAPLQGCFCGNQTSIEVQAFTLVYGKKKYLPLEKEEVESASVSSPVTTEDNSISWIETAKGDETAYCSYCNSMYDGSWSYCPYCGH